MVIVANLIAAACIIAGCVIFLEIRKSRRRRYDLRLRAMHYAGNDTVDVWHRRDRLTDDTVWAGLEFEQKLLIRRCEILIHSFEEKSAHDLEPLKYIKALVERYLQEAALIYYPLDLFDDNKKALDKIQCLLIAMDASDPQRKTLAKLLVDIINWMEPTLEFAFKTAPDALVQQRPKEEYDD